MALRASGENEETRHRQRGSVSATSTRQRSIAEAVSGAAALVRGGRGSRVRRSPRAPPSCLPQDKCGLIFSAHVLCLSHRGVGDVSPKTSLVRLCLRLFSSHKVHRAHSRAPAVFNAQPLCQCCCATPSLQPFGRRDKLSQSCCLPKTCAASGSQGGIWLSLQVQLQNVITRTWRGHGDD